MAWTVEFLPAAAKELRALDHEAAARIVKTLRDRIAALDDPRSLARPLRGEHEGYFRWRVGDYRIIGQVDDATIRILVVRIGHRRDVYR